MVESVTRQIMILLLCFRGCCNTISIERKDIQKRFGKDICDFALDKVLLSLACVN